MAKNKREDNRRYQLSEGAEIRVWYSRYEDGSGVWIAHVLATGGGAHFEDASIPGAMRKALAWIDAGMPSLPAGGAR